MASRTIPRWIFTHRACGAHAVRDLFQGVADGLGLSFSSCRSFPLSRPVTNDTLGQVHRELLAAGSADIGFDSTARYLCLEMMDGMRDDMRAVHVVRDPRDVLVASYYIHRDSKNKSLSPVFEAQRRRLRALSVEDGLLDEMRFIELALDAMAQWNYRHPRTRTVWCESLFDEPDREVPAMLAWLRIEASHQALAELCKGFSRSALNAGNGCANDPLHPGIRGGVGGWRAHFTPRVRQAFIGQYGRLLIEAGYERDLDW